MLTDAATDVNAPSAVMWTLGEIAKRDGVSKPAVSRKIKQLVDQHNLMVMRDEQGRVASVNIAQYDLLRGRTDNPSKAQATKSTQANSDPLIPAMQDDSYNEALRRKTWIEAEARRFQLDKEKGLYVRAAEMASATTNCGKDISRVVSRLSLSADDLAAAMTREGLHGLRVELKKLSERMLIDIANSLGQLAAMSVSTESPQSQPTEQIEMLEQIEAAE